MAEGGGGGRVAQPKMSMRVLLESLHLGQYYRFFQQAGMSMIDGHTHWSDNDVDDILNVVERRTGYTFAPKERVLLWKALRLMWARGPGHDCPFIQGSEVPPMFLPKRDWRQMDSDVKFGKLEPDRQRQIIRKKQVVKGGKGLVELQFEVYIRQQDIFYELKDIQNCVASWMKADPRKMLREDPREEAMKLRIRTMMDAAAGYLQVRKGVLASKRRSAIFFLLCRIVLCSMSLLMFFVGWSRYGGSPGGLQNKFWFASGQFRSGSAFMLAYWTAFLVADRTKEDTQNRRFQRIIIALERLMEEISSFRVETDHLRMEEHEAVQRNESAAITYEQNRNVKLEVVSNKPKRRRKKKIDKDLAAWAPGVKLDNMEEFKLKTQKAIEESYKRLPPLPDNFRRVGGDRMLQFEDKGQLGGVEEHIRHIKAPWQMERGEPRPRAIEIIPPEDRPKPPERRPPAPGASGPQALEDLRRTAAGEGGGWDQPPALPAALPDDEVPETLSMREAMRTTSGSLPPSRARTHSLGVGTPRTGVSDKSDPLPPPVFPPQPVSEALPEVPPLEPLAVPAAAAEEPRVPEPKAKRSRRRGSKDVADDALIAEQQAGFQPPGGDAAQSSGLRDAGADLRDAGAAGGPPPLPPPSE